MEIFNFNKMIFEKNKLELNEKTKKELKQIEKSSKFISHAVVKKYLNHIKKSIIIKYEI